MVARRINFATREALQPPSTSELLYVLALFGSLMAILLWVLQADMKDLDDEIVWPQEPF
jgi:hypothetical protein